MKLKASPIRSVPCRMRCEDSQAPAQLSLTININMNVNEFIKKYDRVEVGYPSEEEPNLLEFAENRRRRI